MPRARKKHLLVCIICLKRVESEKVSFQNSSYCTENPGPEDKVKDTPLITDLSGHGQEDGKGEEECGGKTGLYRRFLIFIHQYFKLRAFTDRYISSAKDAKSEDGSPVELETFCEGCGQLVGEICGLYKQIKSTELLLVWRLSQVGELMKKSKNPMTYKLRKELWSVMAKQMNLDAITAVNFFRRTLKVKCTQAMMKSLPDVNVHKGLFPDEWKFTFAATKKALIRLIVVFILGSSQFRNRAITVSIDETLNINDEVFAASKPCPKSKKKNYLEPIVVKNEPGNGTAFGENVDEDDEIEMPDNLDNHSDDSDWSQGVGVGSPMSAYSDSDLPSDEHGTPIKTRRISLRNRRNIIVKAYEDEDTTSGSDDPTPTKKRPKSSTKSNENRQVNCPQCHFLFKDIPGLARHLRFTHRTDHYYDCDKCGMRFKRKMLLHLHSKIHESRKVRKNARKSRSGTSYNNRGPYRKPTPCPKCSIMFRSRSEMLGHHRQFHKSRSHSSRYECPYCFKKIFSENIYKVHVLNHEQKNMADEEVDIWYCEVCGMQFFKEENLKLHMNKSHEDKYICSVCNQKLDTGKILRDHLISHEKEDDNSFQCHICLKGFTTKQFCEIHRKLAHMDKWKFVCDFGLCSDIFDTISEFNEHLNKHVKEDKAKILQIFNCKTCDLGFLNEYNLTLHELMHTPEGSEGGYPCPRCDKVFKHKETLYAHYNAMHGEKTKPYQCGVCDKHLSHARWYRAHVRLHEERLSSRGKFICDVCGVRCVDSIGLSGHRQNHEFKSKKEKDVRVPVELKKGRKTMKLNWKQNIIDLMMDPGSPPPQGVKNKKDLEENGGDKEEIKEKAKKLNIKVKLSCDAEENCGVIFDSAYLLRKHLEKVHEAGKLENEKNIQCLYCYQRFFYEQSREIHVRNEHKRKLYGKFKCDWEICEEEPFLSVEELNDHLKSHVEVEPEPHSAGEAEAGIGEISFCEACGWGFARPEMRDLHQLIHIPPDNFGRYPCPLCGGTYGQNFIQFHFNREHGSKETEYKCELCGKYCISRIALSSHRQWHRNPLKHRRYKDQRDNVLKELKCFKCLTEFDTKAILMAHVKESHPENYYICEVSGCGEEFSNKSVLWNHMKSIHKHKCRSFVCDLCGMAFYNRHHLEGHMDTHKPKSVTCDICGKMFRREKQMERHKAAVHNPNRSMDFVCSVCGKSFYAQGGLTYHFDSCHKPQSEWHLKCPKCPRRFYRSTLMHLHVKKCDGSGRMKDEENDGGGGETGAGGNSSRKRGQGQPPRKGGRQKKKRVESDEEEEEMEDKSTTEDEDEEEKPSTSTSFQNNLSLSSAYQQEQMWSGPNMSGVLPEEQAMLHQNQGHDDGVVNFPPMTFSQQQLQRRHDMP